MQEELQNSMIAVTACEDDETSFEFMVLRKCGTSRLAAVTNEKDVRPTFEAQVTQTNLYQS